MQRKNLGILPWEKCRNFYFSHMIKFANFEFIFAIGGPKLAKRGEEHRINMA